jgi:hypothetical protein
MARPFTSPRMEVVLPNLFPPLTRTRPNEDMDSIATRTIEVRAGDEARHALISIAPPEPAGEDWRCGIRIEGLGDPEPWFAFGVDSVQALVLALAMASAEVEARAREAGVKLQWHGASGVGLPPAELLAGPSGPTDA